MEPIRPEIDGFVSIRNLTKKYNGFTALNGISFNIKEGEIFGYIGPNGAGKTTTMKILVGLITQFQGEAQIGGYQVPKQKEEIHKLLGYLPQSVAFQDWRTVNHALTTFGKLSGLSEDKINQRIPEILDLLSLGDARRKKISHLSGGMMQKVGLAQALLHEPKFLVLDEPLSGLDPLSRNQFKEIVRKLSQNGATILFSSHILSDVQDVADRIGIINHGNIKQIGTLNELKSHLSPQRTVQVLLSYVSDRWKELGKIRNVKGVEQPMPGRVLVYLQQDADEELVINDIVRAVVKMDMRIRSIYLLEPSLDEIYLKHVSEAEN
jgi:ABC-2 type transport system ATP-binding protein